MSEHSDTVRLLEVKARGLATARRQVARGSGICADRAEAALAESEAILADAAQNCRDLPNLMPVREAAMP